MCAFCVFAVLCSETLSCEAEGLALCKTLSPGLSFQTLFKLPAKLASGSQWLLTWRFSAVVWQHSQQLPQQCLKTAPQGPSPLKHWPKQD